MLQLDAYTRLFLLIMSTAVCTFYRTNVRAYVDSGNPPKPDSLPSQSPITSTLVPSAAGCKGGTTQVHCPCTAPPCSGHSTEKKKSPWETCLEYAKEYVNGEVTVWKDEIDKLLIFATLFSGVAGAFAVESYHNVKQDPADTTALLLKNLLILQLNVTNPQPNLAIELDPQAPVTAAARRINVYNFLSLILSLSVVMAGILCLQWLREYGQDPRGIRGARHEHLGIRFMRREGMKKWGVFMILKLLPLILLLSLLIFFAGIIELLLGVDESAAIVASIMIGIASCFILVTTALPTFQSVVSFFFPGIQIPECPYKSSQAWILYQILARPIQFIAWAISKYRGRTPSDESKDIDIFNLEGWSGYDWLVYSSYARSSNAIASVGHGVHWLGRLYLQEKEFADALFQCIQDSSLLHSLRSILSMKDPRRATSLSEAARWSPSGVAETESDALMQAHSSDVTVFQTLAHLAEKIERGHPPTILFKERLYLYRKIINRCLDPNIDCPLLNDMDQQDVIPRGTRIILMDYITDLMQKEKDVNESHLLALEHILGLEAAMNRPNGRLFQNVLTNLDTWIKYKGWDEETEQGGPISRSRVHTRALKLKNRIDILRRLVAIKK